MRLMLVDDDPYSIEQLKIRIIQLGQELNYEFEIVAECYSGQSALDQMVIHHPEAVFTDIQMTSMNGIELAKSIQLRWPKVPVVIFSAYPTFEYAREAMRANVVEYLLKPIDIAILKEVLQTLLNLNRQRKLTQNLQILRSIISLDGPQDIPDHILQTVFPYGQYRVLLVQHVDAVYDTRLLMPKYEIDYEPLQQQYGSLLNAQDNVWVLPSDDGRATLLIMGLLSEHLPDWNRFLQLTQHFFSRKGISPTIVHSETFQDLFRIRQLFKELDVTMLERIVIGKPQLISLEAPYAEPAAHFTETEEKMVSAWLLKKDYVGLRNLVKKLFDNWETNGCTNMIMEVNLKRIVQLLDNHFRLHNVSQIKNANTRIEELIHTSHSFTELAETYFAMLSHAFPLVGGTQDTQDAMLLFKQIEMYVSANIGQPLTLQLLTDRFHVSRTVLCNLFRDYGGRSFVEFVTVLRMKMAKQLMRDYPHMKNKEIAQIIGYPDQNYFSYVFKTVTGLTPTKYREDLEAP